ncbi:Uncharacterized protein K3495_g5341 [Podosphaera aphanis]|nr:Uncharacterized protein K3495_g5341 [Podosphaera aphanis]
MAQVPSSILSENKRVKVYELRNNDWFDSGTGFCTGTYVFNEATRSEDARILVQSEREPNVTLLNTKIYKPDGFRKQSETLIIWNEPATSLDMALSFQEVDCCEIIWKFVNNVQQQIQSSIGPLFSDDGLSDDGAPDSFNSPLTLSLPNPSLGSLPDIESQIRVLHNTDQGRDALTKYVISEEYIQKLIPLVEIAEDLEDLASLHRLCNIMKTLILLNDSSLIELAVADDIVLGVVGALEYDPDFPSHKANHRHWLSKEGRYKEVVRIGDDIRKKIHSTYRLQYLKDVVLARILDDLTFSILNSLIFFNQVDIVQHLQANNLFLKELFGIFRSNDVDQERKKDAVLFIQQCCAIAKNLQPAARQQLYDSFLSHGLISVINFALRHSDAGVRVGATDVLVSMIDHDPQMIRQTIFRQMSEKQTPLTDSLIDLLLIESDLGVKAQIADAIKVLLDPSSNGPTDSAPKNNGEPAARIMRQPDPQQVEFVRDFYDESARKLFKPLIDLKGREDVNFSVQQISLFIYLIEILCFFVRQHTHHCKYFVLSQKLGQRISQLLKSPEKYLRLSALKFFRNLVGLQDEFYNQQMMQGNLLEPILDLVLETMPRDTLLNSAALELFTFIGKEKINSLIIHLVENYRDKLARVTCVDTFSYLITRYDGTQGFTLTLTDIEEEAPKRPRLCRGGRWESGIKDLDAQEEEYFNTSDEEEDIKQNSPSRNFASLASSPTKPLVDYLSDEEDETTDSNESSRVINSDENTPPQRSRSPKFLIRRNFGIPSNLFRPTPEKLSEKRRREADEVDELDKLSQANKRRNSPIGAANGLLRRKKSFQNSSDAQSPKTKIAISISPTLKKKVERFDIPNETENSPALQTSATMDDQIKNKEVPQIS